MYTSSWNYDVLQAHARAARNREVAKSLIASMLLAGFVALIFVLGQVVQESRASGQIFGDTKSVTKQQPTRSGVLSAYTPVF